MLMFGYRVDTKSVFDVLKWRSQVTNTKLRALAQAILAGSTELHCDRGRPSTSSCSLPTNASQQRPSVAANARAHRSVAPIASDPGEGRRRRPFSDTTVAANPSKW
jgi:hypothetical protein